jgi:hypothetical protein
MPAKSKKQFKFMAAVAHGGLKKSGLSKRKAEEFLHGVDYKKLPKRKSK